MNQWLMPAFISLFSFGLWGLFGKLTVLYIDSKAAFIYQTIGVVVIGLLTLTLPDFKFTADLRGLGLGILTGMAYAAGCLFFFIAVSKGKVITIVTLTALYPLITILLSYLLLRETVALKQCIGILFALFSIYLLAN